MASCPACGAERRVAARFCESCGERLGAFVPERRKVATVLFCDLCGSTAMGERLDAESVREIVGRYFALVRASVERHGGTIEKFVGDAAMAVFGVPVAHEDDAVRGVRAAVEVRDGVAAFNERLMREYGCRIALRVGVNTGEVVAGDPTRRESFVAGDAVNVAARFEQAAGAGEILIGEVTHRLCNARIVAAPSQPIVAKGKSEPLRAYRVVGLRGGAPAPLGRDDVPMIGRSRELALLGARFERAAGTRRCVLATIVGEAGVGKSRLVAELCKAFDGRARVLRGGCLSYGDGITFWPLAEIVRAAAGIDERCSAAEARERIAALAAPWVAERVAVAVGLGDRASGAEEIATAFRMLLEGLARERPLVCWIEDLHWAERSLLDLLLHLREHARAPMLLVCTARLDLLAAAPEWPVAVQLAPLGEEASAVLVEQLSAGGVLTRDERARVVAAAGGVPLFAEELVTYACEQADQAQLPASVRALLTARLDRLPEDQRSVAECAAIEGRLFHRDAIVALADDPARERVGIALDALVAHDVVRPAQSALTAGAAYEFRHALVREAVYQGSAKRLRAQLHERFADWLEAVVGARLPEYEEIVGYHLEQAHRLLTELAPVDGAGRELARRAAERLIAAGQRAGMRGDDRALSNLFGRAAALLPPSDPGRAALLPELGTALMELGEFDRARAAFAEGLQIAGAVGDARLRARCELGRDVLRESSDPTFGPEPLRRTASGAIAVFATVGDERGLAHAWRATAWAELGSAHAAAMLRALERSIDHARRAGDHRQEVEALLMLPMVLVFGPTPLQDGIARCQCILAEQTAEPKVAGFAWQALGLLRAMEGRFDAARGDVKRGSRLFFDLGLGLFSGQSSMGELELLAGDLEAAEAQFRRDLDQLERLGETSFYSTEAVFYADAVHRQGKHAEAVAITELAERATSPGDIVSEAGWRTVRAKALSQLGAGERAETLAREGVGLILRTDFLGARGSALLDLAEVLDVLGRADEAHAAARAALAEFERKGNLVEGDRARRALVRLTAAR